MTEQLPEDPPCTLHGVSDCAECAATPFYEAVARHGISNPCEPRCPEHLCRMWARHGLCFREATP